MKEKLIKIKTKNLNNNLFENYFQKKFNDLKKIKETLLNKTIIGNEFTGWLDWTSSNTLNNELKLIDEYKEEFINKNIQIIVVIAIGGSLIGTKAVADMCCNFFNNKSLEIIYVDSLDTKYNANLINYLSNKNWAMITISKSGTTFETMINFRIFRELLHYQFDSDWKNRIIIITDNIDGKLRKIAQKYRIKTLSIAKNIGGRFSTITAVGLMIFSLLNLNINDILLGWNDYIEMFTNQEINDNSSAIYALLRYIMKNELKKDIEVFCTYEKDLRSFSEFYKQIFAESEGKNNTILFPTIANYSSDLHSIGQLYQQGPNNFFETILMYKNTNWNLKVPSSSFNNDDNLDNVLNKNLLQLNYVLQQSVIEAHSQTPTIIISFENNNEYCAGQLLAFFCLSAVFSACLNNVNPFDQNGVENYKSNLKKILG